MSRNLKFIDESESLAMQEWSEKNGGICTIIIMATTIASSDSDDRIFFFFFTKHVVLIHIKKIVKDE